MVSEGVRFGVSVLHGNFLCDFVIELQTQNLFISHKIKKCY